MKVVVIQKFIGVMTQNTFKGLADPSLLGWSHDVQALGRYAGCCTRDSDTRWLDGDDPQGAEVVVFWAFSRRLGRRVRHPHTPDQLALLPVAARRDGW